MDAPTPATLLRFLVGDREAILRLAGCRRTLWLGAVLVLAAGLAREYDQEDLLRAPWYLAIPFGASTVVAFLVLLVTRQWGEGRPFWREFSRFLGLFWMTAPIGLLYGIPYERFLSPTDAMNANLWTLAVVAAWRVLLMARVTSVFTGRGLVASFFLIMPIADGLAALGLMYMPVPLMSFMGGIPVTPAEHQLSSIHFLALTFTTFSWLVWLLFGVGAYQMHTGRPPALQSTDASPRPALWAAAIACVAIWLVFLPATQRAQRLRTTVERQLYAGDYAGALTELSRHQPADYPPHWSPPPLIGWPTARPDLLPVVDAMAARTDIAPWVRAVYVDKFERRYIGSGMMFGPHKQPEIEAVLDRLPESAALRSKHAEELERFREIETLTTRQAN